MPSVPDLTIDNASDWAVDHLGELPTRVAELAGGVSNTVLLLETPTRRIVVKQSLPQLRVQAEWLCDRTRVWREYEALRVLSTVLPSGTIPRTITEDRDRFAFAMEAAPVGSIAWKTLLLEGECSLAVAENVGANLGRLIGATWDDQSIAAVFDDLSVFDDLRLDAYYRFTAMRHPGLAANLYALEQDCRTNRRALVHGDFSPKNLLVTGNRAIIIDWECVHFGNPTFDVAFLLNHFLLKSFHRPGQAEDYAHLAHAFLRALADGLPHPVALEQSALAHWGGLLLARIDGKSPAEYLTEPEQRDMVRRFAIDLLLQPGSSADEVFERRLAIREG